MKKISKIMALVCFLCTVIYGMGANCETLENDSANQIIEMEDNKINVILMKQPLNEKSNQKILLKRNWLGAYIQLNGKVKVNPLTSTYEAE